jgi:crossover junction endodeoxyribonuclease RusA
MSEGAGVYTHDGFRPTSASPAVQLPWPDKRLSPNARVHWAVKDKARHEAKETAYFQTYQVAGEWQPPEGPLLLTVQACPPALERKRDLDNVLASLKPTIDGLCHALKIDDSRFAAVTVVRGDPSGAGSVTLEVSPYSGSSCRA